MLSIGVQVPDPTLSKDMITLLGSETFADVTFVLGEAKFKAHRCILASRCQVFNNMFSVGMKES